MKQPRRSHLREKIPRQGNPQPKPVNSRRAEWFKSFAMAGALFLLFRAFVGQAYAISSGSMENSLLVGDYLMANNAIYGRTIPFTRARTPALRDPAHGDIVVFRPDYNDPVLDVVKRVIGVPGDTLQMVEGVVYRDGNPLHEPYVEPTYEPDAPMVRFGRLLEPNCCYQWHLDHLSNRVTPESYRPTRDNWGPLVVPEDKYFMLGDNRDQSLDSRYAGFIPREVIRGKAMFIYYSVDRSATGPLPVITAIRTGRIGKLVH